MLARVLRAQRRDPRVRKNCLPVLLTSNNCFWTLNSPVRTASRPSLWMRAGPVPITASSTPAHHAVSRIFYISPFVEVVTSNTRRIVAVVEHVHAGRDLPFLECPRHTMRASGVSRGVLESAVALLKPRPRPHMAGRRHAGHGWAVLVDFRKEPFF